MNKSKVLFAAGMNAAAVYLAIRVINVRRGFKMLNKRIEDAYLQRTDDDIVVDDNDMDASVTDMFQGFGEPSAVPPEITERYGRPEHSAGAKEHREKVLNEESPVAAFTFREGTPEDLNSEDFEDFDFLIGSPAVLRSIIAGTADSDITDEQAQSLWEHGFPDEDADSS